MLSSVRIIFFLNILDFILADVQRVMYNVQQGSDNVNIEQKINMALAFKGMSQAELARKLGQTPSNLNQKVKRNTLTKEEMELIAEALGGFWRAEFVFENADGKETTI